MHYGSIVDCSKVNLKGNFHNINDPSPIVGEDYDVINVNTSSMGMLIRRRKDRKI